MDVTDNSVIVAGGVVVLTGPALRTTLSALLIAAKARSINGLPSSNALTEIAQAVADAMAATGQSDVRETEVAQHLPQQQPTMPIAEAAEKFGLSRRQTRRLAPKLGGKFIGGRWLLDEDAVREHATGRN